MTIRQYCLAEVNSEGIQGTAYLINKQLGMVSPELFPARRPHHVRNDDIKSIKNVRDTTPGSILTEESNK